MNTITPKMTMKQRQAVLDKGGQIKFTSGSYSITDTLYLSSNSSVVCDKDVTFVKKCKPAMFMTRVTDKTTKFNGVHDLSWTGGDIVSDVTGSTQSNIFSIVHAKGVLIQNVRFFRDRAQHCIEVNASKDVQIISCTFSDHKPYKDYKEAIQIDFANYAGLTYAAADAPTYDGTHCRDISIRKCIFSESATAIGTHTVSHADKFHKGILIDYCDYFGDKTGVFARLLNMRAVTVTNNYVEKALIAVLATTKSKEVLEHGGTVTVDSEKHCKNVTVKQNQLIDCYTDFSIV